MPIDFEELDYRQTDLGELILRRRGIPSLGGQAVFEVKLGDEFLMSSLFNEGEVALARLGLAELAAASLDVVVGGLGLGYTAAAALEYPQVATLLVIEALAEVIDWHQRGLVPLGATLSTDPRCRLIRGDFFALMEPPAQGFDPQNPERRFHAILLDIDHSPRKVLHPRHQRFYEPDGLRQLTHTLHPGGIFGLWSDDPPDDDFLHTLKTVFAAAQAHVVTFPNPLLNSQAANTLYIARTAYD